MRIVFMGSAELACPSLCRLVRHEGIDVVGVVTQPDRPKGRRLETSPCAVKARAMRHDLRVLTPEDVNVPESVERIGELSPDLIVVVAYGQILQPPLLAVPPLGCVNVHASLLPKYRGAAPIQWAIANGDPMTGVSIMYMNERMDMGDIILQRETAIGPEETAGELHERLAELGAELLIEAVDLVREGSVPHWQQREQAASRAPKLKKSDGHIDWSMPAETIRNRVRAFNPWPCCYTNLPGGGGSDRAANAPRTLRVLRASVEPLPEAGAPAGRVVSVEGAGPLVSAGDGLGVRLREVQPEGRRVMGGDEFLRGYGLAAGERLS
jgi:methionyl-tRNA formyltransferase